MENKIISLTKLFPFFYFLLMSLASVASTQQEAIFVDVNWLAKHQSDSNLLIVDVRSEKKYLQGHIPHAVNISVADTFKNEAPKDMIGGLRQIQSLFSNNGVTQEQTILIYSDDILEDAGRVFWVFEVFGQQEVKILNGGLHAWMRVEGNRLSRQPAKPVVSNYFPMVEPGRLASLLTVNLAMFNNEEVTIIDVRTENEYLGKESKSKRFGHIPKAINIPVETNFIEKDGMKKLKSLDELKSMYANHSDKIITYCNKGKDAALSYTVLRALGKDVSVYDGSWFEWGNHSDLPIEKQ